MKTKTPVPFHVRALRWFTGRKARSTPLIKNEYGGNRTYSNVMVDEDAAMRVSAAWACVRILAESIGSLPWAVYRHEGGNVAGRNNATRADDHQLAGVLASPNADMTSVEFREAMVYGLALRGNAYSLIERNRVGVVSLYPLQNVIPERKENGDIVYQYNDRGKREELPQDKVWHVKGFGPTGLVGLSPLQCAREVMGVSLATQEMQARFFANGAVPTWIVSIAEWLEEDERIKALNNLQRLWGGVANAYKAQLLEGGMKAEPATMPLEDAQFLQLRTFSVQEICRIYRVPPHMVAEMTGSTNNNIEQQGLEFVMLTLQPYLTRIEASAVKWLLPPEQRRDYFLRFNVEGLLRADADSRSKLYASGLQNGWLTRNEVRALENRNSAEGLDEFTCQSNLTPVRMLPEIAKRQAEKPTPKPAPAPGSEGATDDGQSAEPASAQRGGKAMPGTVRVELAGSGFQLEAGAGTAIAEAISEGLRPEIKDITRMVNAALGPELRAMGSQMEKLSRRIDHAAHETSDVLGKHAELIERVAAAAAAAGGPRKPVYDKKGNPVGTVPCTVDELEDAAEQ